MKKLLLGLVLFVVSFGLIVQPKTVNADSGVPGFLDTLPSEKVTGVLVTENMPVIIFPMNRDGFYKYWKYYPQKIPEDVRTYELSGVEIGYKDLFMAPDPQNKDGLVRYTILYHTTGSPLLAIGIFDRGYKNIFGVYQAKTRYYSKSFQTNTLIPDTEHTVMGDYYPNKIINDLEVSLAIIDYQEKNGPFVAGKEYSMLQIMDFRNRSGYVMGTTSSGAHVTGGGACVMATNWMKILALTGASVTEHWKHPTNQRYYESPFGGALLGIDPTDATVEWPDYDLSWVQPKTGYVSISATLVQYKDRVPNPFGDPESPADTTEFITFHFSTAKPDFNRQVIERLKTSYLNFRNGKSTKLVSDSSLTSSTNWKRGDLNSQFLQRIAPEERIENFAKELTTDPFLMSLVDLRMKINSLDPKSELLVGNYLKTTPWYKTELERIGSYKPEARILESALNHLDANSNSIPGQKLQCFGLSVLINGMDYRFVGIGGATLGGRPVTSAYELVPDSIKNGNDILVYLGGYRAVEVKYINEVNPGDLYLKYDSPAGHVAAVIDRKTVNGETILLIASANQTNDGVMAIFEVDKNNFDNVFGIPSFKKVVLRK